MVRFLNGNMDQVSVHALAIQRHVDKHYLAWRTRDCQGKPAAGSQMWEVGSQCNGETSEHQVLLQIGKTVKETHEMLVQVYGTEAMSRKCVYEWFKHFRDRKETTEVEPRLGQPSTNRIPDMT